MIPRLVVILLALAVYTNGQNMSRNASFSLFSDQKAINIGDAITIIVSESSQASNNAETATGRSSDLGLGASGSMDATSLPTVDFNMGTSNDFQGKGATKTSGLIKTRISALVDSVYANGNLRIKGGRKLVINGEEQNIFITGIVRPSDIQSDNSIFSYNISEAEIRLEGNGMIDDAQSPGWLTKFFHWIF